MLELTSDQVSALAESEARRFALMEGRDLQVADPDLAADDTLPRRLVTALGAARLLGIRQDDNLRAFLRIEAYSPSFYEVPATHAWITRPGQSPDERFHDYFQVVSWKIKNPDFKGGIEYGGPSSSGNRGGSGSPRTSVGSGWGRFIGWRSRSRDR